MRTKSQFEFKAAGSGEPSLQRRFPKPPQETLILAGIVLPVRNDDSGLKVLEEGSGELLSEVLPDLTA
jgi:hypothetical protein